MIFILNYWWIWLLLLVGSIISFFVGVIMVFMRDHHLAYDWFSLAGMALMMFGLIGKFVSIVCLLIALIQFIVISI